MIYDTLEENPPKGDWPLDDLECTEYCIAQVSRIIRTMQNYLVVT